MKLKETIFGISISVVSSVIIGLTLYAYWKNDFLNFNYFLGTDKLGHFGDFIGGFLGTILTGIATYFVYKTYISQKEELEKQKEELLLNRQLIAQQQFESTFFNMLNVHRELKKEFLLNINKRITSYSPIREENKPGANRNVYPPTTSIYINDFFGIDVLNFIRNDFEMILKYSIKDLIN